MVAFRVHAFYVLWPNVILAYQPSALNSWLRSTFTNAFHRLFKHLPPTHPLMKGLFVDLFIYLFIFFTCLFRKVKERKTNRIKELEAKISELKKKQVNSCYHCFPLFFFKS